MKNIIAAAILAAGMIAAVILLGIQRDRLQNRRHEQILLEQECAAGREVGAECRRNGGLNCDWWFDTYLGQRCKGAASR